MKEIIKLDIVKQEQDILKEITDSKELVETALTPKELVLSAKTIANNENAIKGSKKAIKEYLAPVENVIKNIDKENKQLEKLLKEKLQELVVVKTTKYNKINHDTGEVKKKSFTNRNLGKGVFSYSEPKEQIVVDIEKITRETHPKLFKQVWVIDQEKLEATDINNLPTKKVFTKTRVGILKASISLKDTNELLETFKEVE